MVDALAFLRLSQVKSGNEYLQSICPLDLVVRLLYINHAYVSGSYKRPQEFGALGDDIVIMEMRRVPPLFMPEVWNVCEITLTHGQRMNNFCDRFEAKVKSPFNSQSHIETDPQHCHLWN